jgi:hypothetical protein
MTSKTGFGFDDRIYWTFIRLVTAVHKSVSDALSASSDWTLHGNFSDFQLPVVLLCTPQSQSHSHIATDGQSAPSGAHDQILVTV